SHINALQPADPAYDPTPAPEPLAFQVERAGKPDLVKEADEVYRRVSGFAVLLRRAGGLWRCLNTTRIVDYDRWAEREQVLLNYPDVHESDPDLPPQIEYSPVAIVPARLPFDAQGN